MLGGQGADFLRGLAFWSIRSSVLGRWFCVTGAALCMTWHHFFVAGAILQRHGLEKSPKRIGTRPPALHSTFHFWRKSLRIARFWCCQPRKLKKSHRIVLFLMLSSSKIEEVSQNCFLFDVIKFKSWGSLPELLRFWCCQVQTEEVSQNSFVFKFADRQIYNYNYTTLLLQLQIHIYATVRYTNHTTLH